MRRVRGVQAKIIRLPRNPFFHSLLIMSGCPYFKYQRWENARLNSPGAVQILDFDHAAEHLGTTMRCVKGAIGTFA